MNTVSDRPPTAEPDDPAEPVGERSPPSSGEPEAGSGVRSCVDLPAGGSEAARLRQQLAAAKELIASLVDQQGQLERVNEQLQHRNQELASLLERSQEEFCEADRRKDAFLALLAHELRDPIAPIRNAVEILRLAGDDPAAVEPARDVLYRQVRQLSRIVEDLIDVGRIVEKKIDLRRERVSLAKVVDAAVETCRSRIEACGQRLSVALPREPLFLDVDPARISQVLTNLLNNAAKYTPEGGEIQLSAERARPAPKGGKPTEVVLRVRDSGVGIPAELLPRIFDLYFQGEPVLEPTRSGLGVGLTLVRSLVQMHGGEVEARSAGPGLGSELTVRLPLAKLGSPEREAVSATGRPAEPLGASPRRILVVDDNQDQAETLARLLRVMGHEVRVAFDGLSALAAAADLVPDLALVDIGLPGINGFEVARAIRQQPLLRHAVLVAQTGWGQDEDRRRSIEAGFDHHMVKPLDFDAVRKILASLPAGRQQPSEPALEPDLSPS